MYTFQSALPVNFSNPMLAPDCCAAKLFYCLRTVDKSKCDYITSTGVMFSRHSQGDFPVYEHTCGEPGELYPFKKSLYVKQKNPQSMEWQEDDPVESIPIVVGKLKQSAYIPVRYIKYIVKKKVHTYTSGIDIYPINMNDRMKHVKRIPFESWRDDSLGQRQYSLLQEYENTDIPNEWDDVEILMDDDGNYDQFDPGVKYAHSSIDGL